MVIYLVVEITLLYERTKFQTQAMSGKLCSKSKGGSQEWQIWISHL